jgi:hypothetical protein
LWVASDSRLLATHTTTADPSVTASQQPSNRMAYRK